MEDLDGTLGSCGQYIPGLKQEECGLHQGLRECQWYGLNCGPSKKDMLGKKKDNIEILTAGTLEYYLI